ncbi:uncharacterized protein LOC133850541 [Drosophila sulfurigaster albostrigata]|uniref:uncharacterized protein LOC133850541 n=1 Tax=Drosophila sulfurigaster albostrigata TaxID=89887 RepID=UPI002D21D4FA|nr:uncharacterized protein LOC133850541 [Drosophila sulfurigaster albostrigata]
MCNWDCFDNLCCSPREKSIFLAAWTLAHAIHLIAGSWPVLRINDTIYCVFVIFIVVMVVCHVAGTILLFIGIYLEKAMILKIGVIISSIYPYFHFFTIYLPVVQILFTIVVLRYCKQLD